MTAARVESGLVALVCAVAVAVLGYRLGTGAPASVALGAGFAVLVVAVPGALRLATGLPLLVAVGRAAQLGVLTVGGAAALAVARRVDTVVLAGTGTLTGGELEVQGVHPAGGVAPSAVLRLAGAVAQESDRPLERAIAAGAASLPGVAEFDAVDGLGVRGIVAEVVHGSGVDPTVIAHAVLVGTPDLMTAHDIALPAELATATAAATATGRTPVVVAWDGIARGVLEVGPAVAPSAAAAVRGLRALGLRPVLLAAEAVPAVHPVAGRAGLDADAVVAGVGPDEGAALVRRLREDGSRVAVIAGDGGHEAALGVADLAVGVGPCGSGRGGAGLVLVRGDLPTAVDAIRLARRTGTATRANALWTFTCAAAVLPAAATGLLGPALAAAATAACAAVLVANSLRLQRHGTTGG